MAWDWCEAWPVLHWKGNYKLVKLFMAAILLGFTFHFLFFSCRSTACLPLHLISLINPFDKNQSTVILPIPSPESMKKVDHIDHDGNQHIDSAPPRDPDAMIEQWRVDRAHCDLYNGRWIYDESYPLYNLSACPYLRQEFDCHKYGRPDKWYLKYRWKPYACELPRFDGEELLERWRGNKIMFVGDSLSANNWVSLVCMLHAATPHTATSIRRRKGRIIIVRFKDYEVEIMYHNQPYLVDIIDEKVGRVLRLDSLQSNSTAWSGMDLLIFNTWYWWFRTGPSQPFDYIHDGEKLLKDMDRIAAFTQALHTWAKWVDSTIDPSKTLVVYQGASPSHYFGSEWGQPESNCKGEKHPMNDSANLSSSPLPAQSIVKSVLSSVPKPVHLLDITLLSQRRKDGHPSIYNGFHHMDCGHWCVGGVPDTWNQLLYAVLV